jgi:hypothetical protein
MPDQEDELSQAEPDQAPDQDEDIQFIGFHGTSRLFAQDLVDGIFDNAHFGAVTPGGIASLQFGLGLYVVKAINETDDNAFGLAQYFAFLAQYVTSQEAVILKVYATGFQRMKRLYYHGNRASLPENYLIYDYVEGPITSFLDYTQIKFNPHIFPQLRLK